MAQKDSIMPSMTSMAAEKSSKWKLVPWFLAVALVLAIAAAGYFYWQTVQLQKNPQQQAIKEAQELVAKVSKLIVLPTGETPTIATVSDPDKLKEQPFFANAQKGDKVLIFTNAKKAILYSPTSNKIVEVAPINIGSAANTSGSSTAK